MSQPVQGSGAGVPMHIATEMLARPREGNVDSLLATLNLEQLTCPLRDTLSLAGFLACNTHLTDADLKDIGWFPQDVVTPELVAKAHQYLNSLQYALVDQWIQAISVYSDEQAANSMFKELFNRTDKQLPRFVQYENIKFVVGKTQMGVEVTERREGYWFYLPTETFSWPDKPVFHSRPGTGTNLYGIVLPNQLRDYKGLFPSRDIPAMGGQHRIGAWAAFRSLYAGDISSQVDTLVSLEASHLMSGIFGFKRNFNPRMMTLESKFANDSRKACLTAYLKGLTDDMSDAVSIAYGLMAAAAEDAPTEEVDAATEEGDEVFSSQLADMMQQGYEPERKSYTELLTSISGICALCHGSKPCRFWDRSWGDIPAPIKQPDFNAADMIGIVKWPVFSESPPSPPEKKQKVEPVYTRQPKTLAEMRSKLAWLVEEENRLKQELKASGQKYWPSAKGMGTTLQNQYSSNSARQRQLKESIKLAEHTAKRKSAQGGAGTSAQG